MGLILYQRCARIPPGKEFTTLLRFIHNSTRQIRHDRSMTNVLSSAFVVALLPVGAFAHSYGPAPKLTGAPGENVRSCQSCHATNALNSGTGSVQVVLASGPNYLPGVKQRVIVQVTDAVQRRWGFELSARLSSDSTLPAGELTPVDNQTQVICDDNAPRPCGSGNSFITQTSAGSRNGLVGAASFQFDWTPPATSTAGPVTFFVAGNAANGNGTSAGDFIYTSSVQLTPLASAAPTVSSVVSSATLAPGPVSQNSWVTIFGSNLSATSRPWKDGDFLNGAIPTSLDGVSVTVNQNNQPRVLYVGYVSPTQINFLLPSDLSTAAATVQVKNPAGTSLTLPLTVQTGAGQMFTVDGKYILGSHANGSLLGKVAPSTPAAKGETITLLGTGLGATTPALIPGQVPTAAASLATLPTATIGGIAATVVSAAIVPGSPGLYQLTVQVPASVASGDQPVIIQVGTVATASTLLTIQ
jgi:uncharacterized protein (TIGR03437 family)